MHLCRTRLFERQGAGFRGRPGGQDIVHQQQAAARHLRRIRNLECRLHIAPARLGRCHRALAPGRFDTHQGISGKGHSRPGRQSPRQLRRLVISPLPQPEPVQRHGHDQIGFGQKRLAAARQPLAESGNQIQAVGVLEGEDRTLALFVISENGASPVEGRRRRQARGAARSRARIESKWQAAAIASRSVEKSNAAPTGRTKALPAAQRFAAADTKRRKQKIQQRCFHIQSHLL